MVKEKIRILWKIIRTILPDIRGLFVKLNHLAHYFRDLDTFIAQDGNIPVTRLYPCLFDKKDTSGVARGHYFFQDLWVARRIFLANPETHIDVGSRIDGFVSHVASFRSLKVLDIRPLPQTIENVSFVQCDLMNDLDPAMIECCDSLSCLHALEHFGLGRYGDLLRNDGHIIGLNRLHAILKPGGKLYLSLPIGPLRIEFNAHRVFSLTYLIKLFAHQFHIDFFSYVDDTGALNTDVALSEAIIAHNANCFYGCGIFEMTKI